jgi:CubicO group peptidase (beta-lactamase class C family)
MKTHFQKISNLKRTSLWLLMIFSILIFFSVSSCKKVEEICQGNDCFSFTDFADKLKIKMENDATPGFGFIIYNGQKTNNIYTSGFRRMAADGEQPFTLSNPMHVASISKSITTMALLHLLDEKQMSIDQVMSTFLPGSWTLGSNVDNITFRELLTHRSGFRSTAYYAKCSHSELKDLISNGVTIGNKSIRSYQNVNFALMRLIIPIIEGTNPSSDSDAAGFANAYIKYVQDNVLITAGGTTATRDCKPENSNPTLYYDRPYVSGGGWNGDGDLTLYTGGFGWNISLTDLGNVIGKFAQTEEILSIATRNDMYNGALGINQYPGKQGNYYGHGGKWTDGTRGLNTFYMIFPNNNVHVVLFMNSDSPSQSLGQRIIDAYDDSWLKL